VVSSLFQLQLLGDRGSKIAPDWDAEECEKRYSALIEALCLLLCLRRFLLCIRRCRLSSVLFSLVVVIVPIVRDDADGYADEDDRSYL
jgi:hypothetical protein